MYNLLLAANNLIIQCDDLDDESLTTLDETAKTYIAEKDKVEASYKISQSQVLNEFKKLKSK